MTKLITEVFNLKNTGMRVYKSDFRFQELNREMNKLYDSLEEMKEPSQQKLALRKVKSLLRRESKFAAFKHNFFLPLDNPPPQAYTCKVI